MLPKQPYNLSFLKACGGVYRHIFVRLCHFVSVLCGFCGYCSDLLVMPVHQHPERQSGMLLNPAMTCQDQALNTRLSYLPTFELDRGGVGPIIANTVPNHLNCEA
jgi:hypothetical protein